MPDLWVLLVAARLSKGKAAIYPTTEASFGREAEGVAQEIV
jgi:hypothetical protein